jgi:hypothetical protein
VRCRRNGHARSKLIDGASFGPAALKAIGEAFDAAWAEIAGNFGDDPADTEKARLRLANAVLSIADEDSRDVEVLKNAALQRMARDYRDKTPAFHEIKQPTTSRTDQ